MTEPDPQRLAAELQTYRIELEMQNEELHRVQGELESSRSAWEDLFEFAPVGYCTLDAEGTILKLNLAGAGLLGVPRGHLLKKRLALYLAETSRLAFSAFLADVLAGQTGPPCDVAVLREGADPTILHLAGTAEIAGPTCRITMTDVTERRRAEEALRRSEADFRYLFENSVVGKSITLPSGEVRVNEAFARMLGHERKDLEGRYWKDLTHPDDIEESLRHVDLLLSGKEESVHFSKRYLRKDGSVVWAEAWSSLRRDESGSPLYVTTNVVDITERKRAETEIQNLTKGLEQRVSERTKELRRAMEYNRSLIEASIDPLVTIGRDGRILDVNEATVQATGSPRSELVGSDFSEYFTEPDRARAGYERVFSEGTVRDYELHLKRRDALPLPVEYNATVYRDSSGEVQGVFAAARDLSERKRIEAELARTNEELDAFAYSVSHDLRAPLRAIEGFSGMLVQGSSEHLTAEDQRLLGVVRTNTRKMSVLIDDLLTFSRTGRGELRKCRVMMRFLARSAFDEVVGTPEAREKIDFRLGPLPDAEGENKLIRQVWINLLSNALKFSARQENPMIEVSGAVEEGLAVYHVRDNGVGFDSKYADKLFGVFQRLHGVKEFEGTGIGLALVKRILERHGGRVWAQGALGEGATFSFSLPVRGRSEDSTSWGALKSVPGSR